MKKILKIDIDGVIRNISPGVLHIYNTKYNKSNKIYTVNDITAFHYTECFPDFPKDMNYEDFFTDNREEIFGKAKPFPFAIQGLKALKEKYEIVLVTAQFPGAIETTKKWLKEYDVPYDRVVYTFNKNEVDGWILLDDRIENLEESTSISVCMSRPWNRKWDKIKVNNFVEFISFLNAFTIKHKVDTEPIGMSVRGGA